MQRFASRALAVVFVAAISAPLAANFAGVDGADPGAENRTMAEFPRFDGTAASLRSLPSGFDAWFSDHFGFRATFVRWNAAFRFFVLGTTSSQQVMVGRDRWLFYADDGAVEDIGNTSPLSKGEVKNWREAVVRAKEWLDGQDAAFVFAIAPDKHVVYPENLPAGVGRAGSNSRTGQVLDGLADLDFALDLRPALLAAKARERLYHVTDTHWNERGLFVAYEALIGAARRQKPGIPPAWSRDDFEAASATTEAGDLAGMLGLKRVLREERLRLTPKRPRLARVVEPPGAEPTAEEGRLVTEIPGSGLPRAVIFRDSFASPMVPFLSEHFSRAVYVWQNDFDASLIRTEHPDVVFQEIVGRHLYAFVPSPELVPR
jgi:hypothetical protein